MPSTFNILSLSPQADAQDVSAATPIVVAIHIVTEPLTLYQVTIDGNVAFTFTPPFTYEFTYPDFSGKFVHLGAYLSVVLQPRRNFDEGETVEVDLAVTNDASGPSTEVSTSYFHVAQRTQALLDTTLQTTRIDSPLTNTVALETLRLQVLSVLRPRLTSVSCVQLYYRVYYSQLKSVAPLLGLPATVLTEVLRVLPEDVGPLNTVVAVTDPLMVLFDPALNELAILGVNASDLDVLRTASTSPYPQDRVGAVCAAILYAARQFNEGETILPGAA